METKICKASGIEFPIHKMTTTTDGYWVDYQLFSSVAYTLKKGLVSLKEIQDTKKLSVDYYIHAINVVSTARKVALFKGLKDTKYIKEIMQLEETKSMFKHGKKMKHLNMEEQMDIMRNVLSELTRYDCGKISLEECNSRGRTTFLRTIYLKNKHSIPSFEEVTSDN